MKKIKSIYLLVTLATILALTLSSCDKPSDGDITPDIETPGNPNPA
ncbi:hypothetical protein ACFCT7_16595 [Fulvivirgaceae bacterium LMO-SS25]